MFEKITSAGEALRNIFGKNEDEDTRTTAGLGWTGDATAITAAAAVEGGTLGIISATAGADATRVNNWADVGTTDRRILITSTNTGAGEGFVTVRYVQNNNLS